MRLVSEGSLLAMRADLTAMQDAYRNGSDAIRVVLGPRMDRLARRIVEVEDGIDPFRFALLRREMVSR